MKRRSPPIKNDSRDFYCPSCGTSAFELVGTHVDVSSGNRKQKSIILRCFDCQQLFQHQILSEELAEMPVQDQTQEPIALAGSASGS